jgi:hypothetical protein
VCTRSRSRLKRTEHLPDENLIFEGHFCGIGLLEPGFRGVLVGEYLDLVGVTDLLAGVDIG